LHHPGSSAFHPVAFCPDSSVPYHPDTSVSWPQALCCSPPGSSVRPSLPVNCPPPQPLCFHDPGSSVAPY
jgi:hypothetical protein